MYSDNDNQNEKKDWKSYITLENIERYAPAAALAPAVVAAMSLLRIVLGGLILLYIYISPIRAALSTVSGVIKLFQAIINVIKLFQVIICIVTLAATAGLVYVAIKKKEISNVWVWVSPVAALVACISCAIFAFSFSWNWFAFILGAISFVIGLEMLARITIAGQPMESHINQEEAFATYKNYADQYLKTEKMESSMVIANPENSYFDGSGFELLGYTLLTALVSTITCGIAAPWMICKIYKWRLSHTVINGRRFTFDGTGAALLGHWIIWEILSVVTCGIFTFFAHVALRKWELSHTYIDGEPIAPGSNVSYFDGNSFQYFGYGLLGGLLMGVTCGIATPWVVCMLQKWDTKHQIVNNRRLVFSGTGLGFLGEYIIIALLSIITCGIYTPWGIVRQMKYIVRHTDFVMPE